VIHIADLIVRFVVPNDGGPLQKKWP